MDKFVISNKQNITQNLLENITNEQEIMSLKYMHCSQDFTNNTCYSSSAERSFSKLKLIKSYLRSTMSQERLSGLVILSIENEMLEELEYKNLISQFAYQKVRKINFK